MSAGSIPVGSRKRGFSLGRILIYVFCTLTALLWLVPLVGALYASLRPYQDTIQHGFFSWPDTLNLDNYRRAWDQGQHRASLLEYRAHPGAVADRHTLLLEHGGLHL